MPRDVWLASYPRSGNTFLRIVLRDVFGLSSESVHRGEGKVFAEAKDAVGHVDRRPILRWLGLSQDRRELTLVKTHGKPTDDAKAMYIVRDGRAVMVSYLHYLRDYSRSPCRMEDIISGRIWPGSWSAHVHSWSPERRKNTLLLRYEELRDDNAAACEKIAEFLGMLPLKPFDVSFADLQKLNPRFFRSGDNNSAMAEIQPHLDLFMKHHGATMRELGYLS